MHSSPNSIFHHPFFSRVVLVLLMVALVGCGDDDPAGPPLEGDISGFVHKAAGGPARGATVYLGWEPPHFFPTSPGILDSVLVDESGFFDFEELEEGTYRIYSGLWEAGSEEFSQVSPFSKYLTVGDKMAGEFTILALEEIEEKGVVAGEVFFEDGEELVPAEDAEVLLYGYLGAGSYVVGETVTGPKGGFTLTGVMTGNYTLVVLKEYSSDAPFPMFMSGESEVFFSTGKDPVRLDPVILHENMVEKPAVYIYPEVAGRFEVGLEFGAGAGLTASEPEYGDGWDVQVESGGRIDGTWDYLFYEISLKGSPRIPAGWCVAWADLAGELASISTELGLNAAERADFLDYWLPRLPRRDFYEIHPVMGADLDAWVKLEVKPAPDSVVRFWLFMRGVDFPVELPAPRIPSVERSGTTVVEWGGAVIP